MIFRALGLRFAAASPDVIEAAPEAGEDPAPFVRRLAARKARAVVRRYGILEAPPWVVGADTVVVVGGQILGQPADAPAARRMIAALAGRTHQVLTAVSVHAGPVEALSFVEATSVRFRPIAPGEIDRYVAEGDWRDKAGAYAIQGAAGVFVRAVEGDAWNVVGFPVHSFLDRARAAGLPVPEERQVRPGLFRLWPILDEEDVPRGTRRWGPRWE
jgi:septum formation protein